MVKKFNKISNELSKELSGFEDLFQDYVESEEEKERRRAEKLQAKSTENYELQNFLEEEHNRLTNLETFFTKKIPAKLNFSQTERLILEQMNRKDEIKEKLVKEFLGQESVLMKNLASMFNSHFS